jgi:hypothetical protein
MQTTVQSPGVTPSPGVDVSPPPIHADQLYLKAGWQPPTEGRLAELLGSPPHSGTLRTTCIFRGWELMRRLCCIVLYNILMILLMLLLLLLSSLERCGFLCRQLLLVIVVVVVVVGTALWFFCYRCRRLLLLTTSLSLWLLLLLLLATVVVHIGRRIEYADTESAELRPRTLRFRYGNSTA